MSAGHAERRGERAIHISGNQSLALDEGFGSGMVESGSLAVFALEDGNGATRRREFLFTVPAGEILFGVSTSDSLPALIAVPTEPSSVVPISSRDLGAQAAAVETWCERVAAIVSTIAVPEDAKPLPPAESHRAGPAEAMYWCEREPGWVRVVSGSPRLAGLDSATVRIGTIVPMAAGLWLSAEGAFELECVGRDTASSEIRTEPLQILSGVFLHAVRELTRRREQEAVRQFEQRRRLERRIAASSLGALSDAGWRRGVFAESPLMAAARLVGDSLGIEVRAAADQTSRALPLASIASASGFRLRRVVLTGDWWRRDNGPLLAYRLEDKSPVALIPKRRLTGAWYYELLDPLDGSAVAVNDEIAASLDSVASSFFRPFGALSGWWELIRFSVRPYRRDLTVVVCCGIAAGILGMAVPVATSVLFGRAIPDADRGLIWQITLGMAAAALGTLLFSVAQSISMVRLQSGMSIALQCGIWDRLLRLRPAFFRRFTAGDLFSRSDAIEKIRRQLTLGVLTSMFTGMASFFYVALMLYYSLPLALIACAAGVLITAGTAWAVRKLYLLEESKQKIEGQLSGFLVQAVNAVGKLRVAGAEHRAFARWGKSYGQKQKTILQIRRIRDAVRVFNATLPMTATALILLWIVGRTEESKVSLGDYLAFTVAFAIFISGLVNLSEIATGLSVATVWNRARPILTEEPEVRSTKSHPGCLSGRIEFDHVSFRYGGGGPLTLEDVCISIKPGECVALVGPSGSGKSTIINLLLEFEVPASGAIYLDGQDLSSLDVSAVRRQFGVVNQDSKLISQSIYENIVCGSACTLDEAWEAARAAAVAEDIEAMPMGMHTVVSEGGSNLSGGQRQRILIARALVQKPSVLIFDEATSALDNRAQARVTESLNRLKTTRIVVAQRLSTIRDAHRIYVIESGRVVQHGTYGELAAVPGPFARLVQRQIAV